jgi:hypothetical protein
MAATKLRVTKIITSRINATAANVTIIRSYSDASWMSLYVDAVPAM